MTLRVTQEVADAWAQDNLGHVRAGSADKAHKLRVQVCPLCGHRKWSVMFNTRMQIMECFRCGGKVSFFELVRKVERISSDADMAVLMKLRPYAPAGVELLWKPGRRQQDVIAPHSTLRRASLSIASGDLWDDFSTDWTTFDGKALLAYAKTRRLTDDWLSSGRVGYFTRGPLAGRLSFVTYEDGIPKFAVARAVRKEVKPKYLSLAGGQASNVVFNLDLVPEKGRAIVNEGCLSAISSGVGGVAVFGNVLSWVQAGKISLRCRKAVIIVEQGISDVTAQENAHRLAVTGCEDVLIARLATEDDPNDNPAQMPEVVARAAEVVRPSERTKLLLQTRRPAPNAKDIFE